ncbi:MAG: hypothetical protein Fur0012_08650 [Elusimicrobiota bacterium]
MFARKAAFAISIFLIFWNMAAMASGFFYNREDWRYAASFARDNFNQGGEVLIFSEEMKYPFSFYYSGKFRALPNLTDIQAVFGGQVGPILYIKSHDYEGKSSIYQKEIEKKLKLTYYLRRGEIEFFRYEKK